MESNLTRDRLSYYAEILSEKIVLAYLNSPEVFCEWVINLLWKYKLLNFINLKT